MILGMIMLVNVVFFALFLLCLDAFIRWEKYGLLAW